MLEIIEGGISSDDRGSVCFVNDFSFEKIKRFYIVENCRKDYARDWHGHKKETIYALVIAGSIIIGVVNIDTSEMYSIRLDAFVPRIVRIPPGCASSFKPLTEDARVLYFSTATLDESLADSYRYPYDKWNVLNQIEGKVSV